jgi:hypothetical protein
MLTPRTAAMIDHGLTALRAAQLLGELEGCDDGELVPEPGEVSANYMAMVCGVSRHTWQQYEATLRERLAHALIEKGIPTRVAAAVLESIDKPQP